MVQAALQVALQAALQVASVLQAVGLEADYPHRLLRADIWKFQMLSLFRSNITLPYRVLGRDM